MRPRYGKSLSAKSSLTMALLLAVALILPAQMSFAQSTPDQIKLDRAEVLYEQRGDLHKAALAADAYRELLRAHPGDVFPALRLCKLLVWVGAQGEGEIALKRIVEARQVAEAAVKAHPGHPGPVFWLGVALGLEADMRGSLEGLSLVEKSEEHVQKVMAVAPSYEFGGPYRVMGRIKTKLPCLFGGDEEQAEKLLLTAVKLGPGYLLNQLYLADLYHKQGRDDEAMKLLVEVRDAPITPGLEPESRLWKEKAVEYLSQSAKLKN